MKKRLVIIFESEAKNGYAVIKTDIDDKQAREVELELLEHVGNYNEGGNSSATFKSWRVNGTEISLVEAIL